MNVVPLTSSVGSEVAQLKVGLRCGGVGWGVFESVVLAAQANFVALCTFVRRFLLCGVKIPEGCVEKQGRVWGPDFGANLNATTRPNGTPEGRFRLKIYEVDP